jgi:L-amino acid N-acyltransferase YncA
MMGRHSASVVVAEAEDGRGLAGCAMGTVVNNEPFTVPDYGYVNCLYVREGHRGSGVGSSLFAGVCDWLRGEGVSVIQADVSARDRASLRFWSARGFERFL